MLGFKAIFREHGSRIAAMGVFVAWLWFFPLFGISQAIFPVGAERLTVFNLTFFCATIGGYLLFLILRDSQNLKNLVAAAAPVTATVTILTALSFFSPSIVRFSSNILSSMVMLYLFPAVMGIFSALYFTIWGSTIFYMPDGMKGRYMGSMVAMATVVYSFYVVLYNLVPLLALILSGLLLLIPSLLQKELFKFIEKSEKEQHAHSPPWANSSENHGLVKSPVSFWLPFALTILCFYILSWAVHDMIFAVIKTDSHYSNIIGQSFYALACLIAAYLLDRKNEIEKTAIMGLVLLGCTFLLIPLAVPFGIITPLYFMLEGSYGLIDLFMWVSLAYFCKIIGGEPGRFYAAGLLLNVSFIIAGILLMPLLDIYIEGSNYLVLSFVAGIILFIGILPALRLREVRLAGRADWSDLSALIEQEISKLSPAGRGEMEIYTKREREILYLMLSGLDNKALRKKLGISNNTLKTHVRHIYEKAGVRNRSELLFLYASLLQDGDS